jgi:hypothetical protein
MTASDVWYRSSSPAPTVPRTLRRMVRDAVRAALPEVDPRGRIVVLPSRLTLPTLTRDGLRSAYHGLFSEFHSVLGALVWARERGAAGVRVAFDSPLYVDPARGPNWWSYFFEDTLVNFRGAEDPGGAASEIRVDRRLARYGRHGGFSDVVQGATPYFYPMTFGVDRLSLHALTLEHARVRPCLRQEAARTAASLFEPSAFVVGVHYRGTDAVRGWAGALAHYRTTRVSYGEYAGEIRRVLSAAAPARYQIFAASDEEAFVKFLRREFPARVCALEAPRADASGRPVHLSEMRGVSNAEKGRTAMLDSLLLASTNYLIKGRSNLSDASLLFNPDLPYSFRPDVPLP